MPVQIGQTSHGFGNPLGLLSDCHRRIEMFLGSLQAVSKVIDYPPTEEVSRSLQAALRYFQEAAPKHTADEEESLFPRLRKPATSEIEPALTRLKELEEQHQWVASLHADVQRLGMKYLTTRSLSKEETSSFRHAIEELRGMYERHISLEDTVIFPIAARVLTDEDQSAIASEMARRREVSSVLEGRHLPPR